MSSDAKNKILARRARFVAAALAGISLGCGKDRKPEPCLSITAPRTDAEGVPPTVCLSAPIPLRDAGSDAGKKACGCDPADPLCSCLP